MSNKTVVILSDQSIFDIALQETGFAYNAYDIYLYNIDVLVDFDASDIAGKEIIIPDTVPVSNYIVNQYIKNNTKVVSK